MLLISAIPPYAMLHGPFSHILCYKGNKIDNKGIDEVVNSGY